MIDSSSLLSFTAGVVLMRAWLVDWLFMVWENKRLSIIFLSCENCCSGRWSDLGLMIHDTRPAGTVPYTAPYLPGACWRLEIDLSGYHMTRLGGIYD
jgi:hypothetical protein